MKCQHCGSKIGITRLITDREYCSDNHRRFAKAQAARGPSSRLVWGDEDLYDVYEILDQPADEAKKQKLAKAQASAAMVLAIVLVFVLAFSWMGNGGPASGPAVGDKLGLTAKLGGGSAPVSGATASEGFLAALRSMIPTHAPMRLREDFRAGLDSWIGGIGAAADWTVANGAIQPGRLRIWEPSVNLSNYRLEFEAQIEHRAVNWTYRSLNLDNFYANKIVMKRPGSLEIVRYAVLDGREQVRTKLPIPLINAAQQFYRVQMQVRGDQFTTLLNGQVVDTWTDSRLRRGGVGFFSEPGERSSIRWVNVNEERQGLLGQLLSLGFFVNPSVAFSAGL